MGLFDNLFSIPHRVAATKIKEYALSLETSDFERSIAQLVNVELYRYVAERHYLLSALARYLLAVRAEATNKEDIKAASGFLEKLLNEYFTLRPGVDRNLSTYHWHLAISDYVLDNSLFLAEKFFTRLTDGRLTPDDVLNIPGFMDLIHVYIRQTDEVVNSSTEKLK